MIFPLKLTVMARKNDLNEIIFNPFYSNHHDDSKYTEPFNSESVFCDFENISLFNDLFRNIPKPYSNIYSTLHLNMRGLVRNDDQFLYFLLHFIENFHI